MLQKMTTLLLKIVFAHFFRSFSRMKVILYTCWLLVSRNICIICWCFLLRSDINEPKYINIFKYKLVWWFSCKREELIKVSITNERNNTIFISNYWITARSNIMCHFFCVRWLTNSSERKIVWLQWRNAYKLNWLVFSLWKITIIIILITISPKKCRSNHRLSESFIFHGKNWNGMDIKLILTHLTLRISIIKIFGGNRQLSAPMLMY